MAKQIGSVQEKLFASVVIARGCWPWSGNKNDQGYGIISMGRDGARLRAHRAMFEFMNGTVQSDMVVRHKCDNPSCCNPSHLEVGTKKQNTADMWSRGRGFTPFRDRVNERHHASKMTDAEVAACRAAYREGAKLKTLASVYSVTTQTIYRIVNHKTRPANT